MKETLFKHSSSKRALIVVSLLIIGKTIFNIILSGADHSIQTFHLKRLKLD